MEYANRKWLWIDAQETTQRQVEGQLSKGERDTPVGIVEGVRPSVASPDTHPSMQWCLRGWAALVGY